MMKAFQVIKLIVALSLLAAMAPLNGTLTVPETGRIAEYTGPAEEITTTGADRWDLRRVEATRAWQTTSGRPDILIAVLDTGVSSTSEALAGKVLESINFSKSDSAEDVNGHGTHIAGIIAASPDYMTGISGLAFQVSILNVKVANDDGTSSAAALADGIRWAVDRGAKVLNISITFNKPPRLIEDAVNYAIDKNVVVVAAAGNDFSTVTAYPAAYPAVIAVSAVAEGDVSPRWANQGGWVDVSAPGVNIYSTLPDDRYAMRSGTSMAAQRWYPRR
jgi:thermitase